MSQECKWNIWSRFLSLTLNKLLMKPVWVTKSLFYLFWHWFITLSYKLQELTSWESRHSSMLFQSCRWKWKGTSTRDFFKLSKKNLPHGCFHNLATFCKWFSGKNKGKKQQHYKKFKQIWYFNVINIAECWCEIDCTSEGSVINQSSSMQLPVATFFQMALFGS